MINLLPPELKESYRFARRNTVLVHWAIVLCCILAGMAAITGGGVWYLERNADSFIKQNETAAAALNTKDQAQVQKDVKEISGNVQLVVQVLSKEVLFSKLLRQVATLVPDKATLANIAILQPQTALDITANTADYNTATQLQVNLSAPDNKIFSKADIVNINCTQDTTNADSEQSALAAKYPCKVTIRALFNTDNAYSFIGSQKAKP